MFGHIPRKTNSTWLSFNSRTGLFTIDHTEQNADGTYREHVNTKGRTVYKEEYPLVHAYVRRVMIREEPKFDKPTEKEQKIAISLRGADGRDAVVKFSLGASALQALGAINGADLSQPVTLRAYFFEQGSKGRDKDGNEVVRAKDEVRLVGYQGDDKITNVYGPEGVEIPKIEKIEVRDPMDATKILTTVNNPTKFRNFVLDLAKTVNTKVEAAAKNHPAPVPAPKESQPAPAAHRADATVESTTPAADGSADPELSPADLMMDDGGAADAEAFAM